MESAGINAAKFKTLAFMISSLVAGLGGAFYVHYLMIAPRNLFLPTSRVDDGVQGESSKAGPEEPLKPLSLRAA